MSIISIVILVKGDAHFIGVFLINVVLNSDHAELGKVFWRDLYKIGDG
jgi:hypothetical protein